eukprot:scaffold158561_cov35-Attheya_sp.AAC.1
MPFPRTDIPSGAGTLSFATHSLNCHAKVTTGDVSISGTDSDTDQQSLQPYIDGLALFGEGVNSFLALSPQTDDVGITGT